MLSWHKCAEKIDVGVSMLLIKYNKKKSLISNLNRLITVKFKCEKEEKLLKFSIRLLQWHVSIGISWNIIESKVLGIRFDIDREDYKANVIHHETSNCQIKKWCKTGSFADFYNE